MAEEKKKADEQACEPEKKDKKPSETKEEKKAKHDYKKECASLNEELASAKDSYLRLAAEYDNFRRRSQQERENVYADAYADALKVLLPTADNLERALKFADGDPAKIVEGVEMTYSKLKGALDSLGIEEIPCEKFDPNYHNAVMHVDDESRGEGEIVEVFEKGYKKGDRVIRYAMVKVAN